MKKLAIIINNGVGIISDLQGDEFYETYESDSAYMADEIIASNQEIAYAEDTDEELAECKADPKRVITIIYNIVGLVIDEIGSNEDFINKYTTLEEFLKDELSVDVDTITQFVNEHGSEFKT